MTREDLMRRKSRRTGVPPTTSIDYRREFRHLYSGSEKKVEIVHAPKMNFIAIDGMGDPAGSRALLAASEVLCRVALELRLAVSRAEVMDFVVMPMETIWWSDDPERAPLAGTDPRWTAMIMQPVISPAMLEDALGRLARDPNASPLLRDVRLVRYYEGLAAQTFARTGEPCCAAAIDRIHRYVSENGYEPRGPVHEIFLDGLCPNPGPKSQRIIRQPVVAASTV
ncbi:MAG TPA: hypothetical protein VLV48_11250 [Thermoanaerobaculia bacterium]|nr:hypothetical protein [Thermoanaerobaculia bacterium]